MKRTMLFIIISCFMISSYAQPSVVDSLATTTDVRNKPGGTATADTTGLSALLDVRLSAFKSTLDTVVFKKITTSNATVTNADTLTVAVNTVAVYQLFITTSNTANNDAGSGYKFIVVKNVGGTVSIVRETSVLVYQGQSTVSTCKWNAVVVGNMCVLRVTGVAATNINWNLSKYKTL